MAEIALHNGSVSEVILENPNYILTISVDPVTNHVKGLIAVFTMDPIASKIGKARLMELAEELVEDIRYEEDELSGVVYLTGMSKPEFTDYEFIEMKLAEFFIKSKLRHYQN